MSSGRGHDIGAPRKMGRPRLLTVALTEKICQLIEAGNYMDTSCAANGISSNTAYEWLRRGNAYINKYGEDPETWPPREQDDELDFANFATAIQSANARAEAYAVLRVREAMPKQWQAAMTFLERRYPHKWRRRLSIDDETTGDDHQRQQEAAMLEDPEAVALMHDALGRVARGEIEMEDADVVVDDV